MFRGSKYAQPISLPKAVTIGLWTYDERDLIMCHTEMSASSLRQFVASELLTLQLQFKKTLGYQYEGTLQGGIYHHSVILEVGILYSAVQSHSFEASFLKTSKTRHEIK